MLDRSKGANRPPLGSNRCLKWQNPKPRVRKGKNPISKLKYLRRKRQRYVNTRGRIVES